MPRYNPILLERSPIEADAGELIGKRPDMVPAEILTANFAEQNPVRAIRAKCLDCCGHDGSEVRKCTATSCALWPFRLGFNPFRRKPELSAEEKARRASVLKANAEARA